MVASLLWVARNLKISNQIIDDFIETAEVYETLKEEVTIRIKQKK